jgi:hypothetical protein
MTGRFGRHFTNPAAAIESGCARRHDGIGDPREHRNA